ncbi:EAL domain-containing protein [Glaciecola sp. 1036]|uniref:EAL domain-containing protein n=1 Tax=Alteromonadaceae TaxID=72275 RepID=UPI003D02192A
MLLFINHIRQTVLLVLIVFSMGASAEALDNMVDADFDDVVNLAPSTELLLAEESTLLSDILQLDDWQPHKSVIDIQEEQSLWLRFTVENPSTANKMLTFIAGNTFMDRAEAYLLDEQGRIIQSVRMSKDMSNSTRFGRNGFKMTFTSRAQSAFMVYLQIHDDGLTLLPVELWQTSFYEQQSNMRLILIGAMSGGLSLLATYFLLTYVLRNAPSRFWFCVFATAAMTTMLSGEGILPSLFMMPGFAAEITSVSLVVTLFAALKIARIIFTPLSMIWIRIHYALLVFPLVGIVLLDDFYQLTLLISFAILFFVSKLLATLFYRKSVDLRSASIYFLGWVSLALVGTMEAYAFINDTSHLSMSAPYPFAFSCIGVMLIGVAIISREQSIQAQFSASQLAQIEELEKYNNLFQHAAEGLYTAKPNGDLLHVNPAICSLFGYKNNDDCLHQIDNLVGFFADPRELDLLLGELSIQQTVLGKEVKGKRRDNSEFWFSISCQLKKVDDQIMHFGSLFDITERRLHQINLQYLNTHDQLTGLLNRRHFLQVVSDKIAQNQDTTTKFALIYLDVDQFKLINDTCGHNAGDIFIKELALELFDVITEKFPFSRLSADQFGILVDYENGNQIRQYADQLLSKVREFEFKWDRHVFNQSVSIGIAPFSPEISTAEELLSFADTACQLAKEGGRDKVHIYSAELGIHANYKREMFWINEVQHALKVQNFEIFYQHYRPLSEQDPRDYFEVLVRLRTLDNDLVAPEFFMPSAEKAHISHKIDKYVIEHFFKWLNANSSVMDNLAKANINLSGFSLSDDDFKFFLLNAFEKYQIPYQKICFEITESMAIIKMKDAIAFMGEFKKLGCTFALDDFGTGFSSYSYLKSLPVDYLKIDGNFIRDILKDKIDLAMVTSIRDVADAMKIQTVAEFVESKEIMVQIGKLGVDFAQGFCIAKPEPFSHYVPYSEISSNTPTQ